MKIAVIGSGISGLGAAWLLDRHHEVTLYEAGDRFGGHTNTVTLDDEGRQVPVDTGFIVFNEINYPHLCGLFRELGVAARDSDMSFAASLDDGRLEYAGDNLRTLFAQRRNLLRPSHWRMLAAILRFNRLAREWLAGEPDERMTLGDFLDEHRFPRELSERYLLPMAAAIWSAPTGSMRDFPALSFLRFFRNHGLLQVRNRPQWKTVAGGGRVYVQRIIETLGERARLNTAVTGVRRNGGQVIVRDSRGGEARYDQVVMAGHADQSLAILEDADETERNVLGAFRFQSNRAWLHSDTTLMPHRRRLWASWNYLADARTGDRSDVVVSYWMNRLQSLDTRRPLFVTLNPAREPDPALTWYSVDYDHPVFDAAAIRAQSRLSAIQGQRRVWFCGAWTAYGFHEDGLRSAVRVAERLDAPPPWKVPAWPEPHAEADSTPVLEGLGS
jgi:predicted NAD/FAD-binding protein